MSGAPFGLTTGPGIDIEKDDSLVVESADTINFEDGLIVIDEGNGKVTIKATAADPFAVALFDDKCNPLFSKDANGTVELLEACV